MSGQEEIVAVDIEEFDPEKMQISAVQTKKWSYKNDQGVQCNGSYPWVEVWYEKPKQAICVLLNDVRTNNGIQTSTKYNMLFMSMNLTDEQSTALKEKIDNRIAELLFSVKKEFLKGCPTLAQMKKPSDLAILMRPVVQAGQPKDDGTEDCYNDQITVSVPSKKENKQVVVNKEVCTISDINGKPYAWAGISGQLKEMAFGITMIKYDEQIKINTEARIITPADAAKAKVTTKRKLEQDKETKVQNKKKPVPDAKPKGTKGSKMQSRAKPAVSAFNSKLKTVEVEESENETPAEEITSEDPVVEE
jgi:hypothetical protein